jgi:pilus assembly protein Flp/PilA
MQRIEDLLYDESGATAIEYGLIAALVCVAIIAGISNVGNSVATTWETVAAAMAGTTP